jgi:phosphotransferase system enzyme I (PtsI)
MRSPVELKGRIASGGIFSGPIVHVGGALKARREAGSPEAERAALETAIVAARSAIAALMEKVESEASDMLAFQLAMLEDEALSAPALSAIGEGAAADEAWSRALGVEIAGYTSSQDSYFQARAADLEDIRDRVLRNLFGTSENGIKEPSILAGEDVPPTLFLETDWSSGGAIALAGGSPSSHVAMLARARGVPMVVGLGAGNLDSHRTAIVDGETGKVILSPDAPTLGAYDAKRLALADRRRMESSYLGRPPVTADGTRIEVMINVAGLDELAGIDVEMCDGIGLMRTEFLFRDGAPLPDEESQYQAYRCFLEWGKGKPVTIRTLDIGGDKPIRGLTTEGEANPFLGLRGVRLTLARPEIFRIQLRALARAAVHGNLKIMVPMVTIPEELAQTARLLDDVIADLKRRDIACARPPLGMMVEVPAAALAPELFSDAAFFSIGSNDLTQYVTAASRSDPNVAALNDPANPAVMRLIASLAEYGRFNDIPVSLCGDMASDPKHIAALLERGLKSLSVGPAALAGVKAAIAAIRLGSLR